MQITAHSCVHTRANNLFFLLVHELLGYVRTYALKCHVPTARACWCPKHPLIITPLDHNMEPIMYSGLAARNTLVI